MYNPFCVNKKGKLRVGELVRVKQILPHGVVFEKQYDVTTVDDIYEGRQRYAIQDIYVGNGKKDKV